MKIQRSLTDIAARVLADDGALAESAPDALAPQTIRALERAITLQARRRTLRRRIAAAAAVAAAFALTAGGVAKWTQRPALVLAQSSPPAAVAAAVQGTVLVVRRGGTDPLVQGGSLGVGDSVLALQDGRGTLALSTGTHLALEGGGALSVLDLGPTQLFALSAGAVRADVAKLAPGSRFILRTADAEIEVHGTSFRVSNAPPDLACGGGTSTRLEVYEGIVTVRFGASEAAVSAGDSWPRGCTGSPGVAGVTSLANAEPPEPSPAPVRPARVAPVAGSSSDLRAQNDAFQEIVAARRRGTATDAIVAADRFLSRYPSGALTEAAMAERMKLLSGVDRKRAAEAGAEYLRRFPRGFARADAESIVRAEP